MQQQVSKRVKDSRRNGLKEQPQRYQPPLVQHVQAQLAQINAI